VQDEWNIGDDYTQLPVNFRDFDKVKPLTGE